MGHEVIEGVQVQKVVRLGIILAGEERIGRDVKVGAINGRQTETMEKSGRLCSFHKQMGQKGKCFREKSPSALHKSGDRSDSS